jgi:hypothetical protein
MKVDWWKHVVPWLEVAGVAVTLGLCACGIGS